MHDFWLSLGMIFLAELGDKTQLVAMTLAARYNARVVLAGIFSATLAVHVFSAAIGWWMGGLLPADWIGFLAGVAFIGFGFWTVRGDCLEDESGKSCTIGSPFWMVFVTFFLAELGDKTMLSTVTLATKGAFIPVWIGSTLGMVASDGLAIMIGRLLGKQLPERAVKIGASIIFFAFGAISMVQNGGKLPMVAWVIGAVVILILAGIFLRKTGAKRQKEVASAEAQKKIA
jgi:putative Ca2+/H+ antiporter (TMEM165/GDT1 family)